MPTSLEVWTQRAGRAGRSVDVQAQAILLVEKSMFQLQKRTQEKCHVEEDDDDLTRSESELDVIDVPEGKR